jgi:hypothetical protein
MRSRALRHLSVTVGGMSLCVAAYACGGSSGAFVSTPADAAADGTTAVGSDDGAPSPGASDSGTVTPALATDAAFATDGQAPMNGDGGAATNDGGPAPFEAGGFDAGGPQDARAGLSCGSATCSNGQFCCAELDGGAACMTDEQACAAAGGAPRRCEKTSDCPASNVCCFDFSSLPPTTGCHANDCSGGGGTRVEACRSQSDCATGSCALRACSEAGAIQSCAPFGAECP